MDVTGLSEVPDAADVSISLVGDGDTYLEIARISMKSLRCLASLRTEAEVSDADSLLKLAKEVESYFQGIDRGNGLINPARTTAREIINRYGSEQEKSQWGGA